jgi:membrane protease YdiL (CAAX protease family)
LNARAFFYDPAGALRAPWRIAVFIAISLVMLVIVGVTIGPILEWLFVHSGLAGVETESWVTVIALLIATAIALRRIDNRPWSDVWLDRAAARPRLLAYGFAVGAFAIGLPVALLIVAHWEANVGAPGGSWIAAALRVSLTLLPAALLEELVTRGYILSVLRESWGWTGAITFTSVAFGLLHLKNPDATPGSLALVTLAGFFLVAVLYVTRSLYAAWMAHFAWNWTMAVLFHTAVSGIRMESPGYRYVDAGPDWATGGPWGPEGGMLAAVGMIAGMAFLFAAHRRSAASGRASSPATPPASD